MTIYGRGTNGGRACVFKWEWPTRNRQRGLHFQMVVVKHAKQVGQTGSANKPLDNLTGNTELYIRCALQTRNCGHKTKTCWQNVLFSSLLYMYIYILYTCLIPNPKRWQTKR